VPTRSGIAFSVLLLVMLVASLNYANSLALAFTFVLAGFALVAMHRCHRNLLGLTLTGAEPQPAFAGGAARLRVSMRNDAGLFRGAVECGLSSAKLTAADLPSESHAHLDVEVPAPRRGVLRVDRLRVTTTFPFGLFRAWTWVHAPLATIVYPRAQGARPPPVAPAGTSGLRTQGGSGDDEWLGLRLFRDGDSPRRVAWKAVARGGPLMVKEYGVASDDLRLFDFDALPGLEPEARLEQLSRWIVDAEARGDRYALSVRGARTEAARGPQHRHRCLRALALYGIPEHEHGVL
jgi:uncharacterized protein (DUF58 family)